MMLSVTTGAFSRFAIAGASLLMLSLAGHAASGEMGTGIPSFGSYSAPTGVATAVYRLDEASIPMPQGCSILQLTAATMGMDAYKIAVATLLVAKTSGKRVRFFAHDARDGGCGVDYVEMP